MFLDPNELLLPAYTRRLIARYDARTAQGHSVGLVTCDMLLLDGDRYADRIHLDMVRDLGRTLPAKVDAIWRA